MSGRETREGGDRVARIKTRGREERMEKEARREGGKREG